LDRLFIAAECDAAGIELPTDRRERQAALREILMDGLDDYES